MEKTIIDIVRLGGADEPGKNMKKRKGNQKKRRAQR